MNLTALGGRGRGTMRRALLVASAGAMLAAAAGPQTAAAAFTLPHCGGGDAAGDGSSFQATSQTNWELNFLGSVCPGFDHQPISYNPDGSGAGRRAVGERTGANADGSHSRDGLSRFAGTDDPLTSAGRTQITNGTDATGDEDPVHEIPVASGAIALIVNFPDNCDVASLPLANQSAPTATDFTNRVRFTKAQLEQVWFGKGTDGGTIGTWGDVFPAIKAIVGNAAGKTDLQCHDQAIVRVKRFDDSGSTFALKGELATINPAAGWLTTYLTPDTRTWPNTASHLIDGGSNGGGTEANAVLANDGSIGYVDLATARSKGFFITPSATQAAADDTYWIQAQNGSDAYADAAASASSFKTPVSPVKGANCAQAVYSGLPAAPADRTFGDWSQTKGVNAAIGYPVCTLTYLLAFDDDAEAYGNTAAEEAKARTVKDYLTYIVTDLGQGSLQPNDYTPLPPAIEAVAQVGVAAISWNKAGDSPGGGPGGGTHPGGGGVTQPPRPILPSSIFSIVSSSVSKSTGKVTLSLQLPGPGAVSVKVKGTPSKGKKIASAGKASVTVTAAGVKKVTFKPSAAVKSALRKGRKVKLTITVVFAPTGGNASAPTVRTLTLKPKKATKKKH